MNNSLFPNENKKPKFSVVLQSNAIKNLINNTLGDPKRASNFIANVSSVVAVNPDLQACDPFTVITGALVGESLNLSLSPQLGHCYLVPFKDKNRGMVATFQIGYKGYIQLAMRSGQYRKINVLSIKEGELIKYDPLNEEIEVNLIEDDDVRETKATVGYYAMFEYLNGFRKTMYWSVKKMKSHAKKYSSGYRNDLNKGTDWTFWSRDFDGMAFKTMLRQLLSKWGIMSVEMQKAFESDMAVIREDNKPEYVDNDNSDLRTTPSVEKPEIVEDDEPEPKKKAEKNTQHDFKDGVEPNLFQGDF
jgi:recombination protein RecT